MGRLGKFQMVSFQHWKGMTTDNHLGAIYKIKPQRATNLWVQMLAYYRGKNTEAYLRQFPVKEFDTDDDYIWEVIGSSRRNIPIIEARDEDGNVITTGNAGVGSRPFYVVFPEDWWAFGNVIVGEKNEIYPLRVIQEPIMEGTNAVYKVELVGGVTGGMPIEELSYGKRFSKEYSPVGRELSREVGDIHFTSPTALRNEFSQIRIRHKVPGNKLGKRLAVGIPYKRAADGQLQVKDMWMYHVEFVLEEEFSEEKSNLLMYGRSNRNRNGEYLNKDFGGRALQMGAGLREQMEVSNVIYYNKFSLKLLESALYQLSIAKLGMRDRLFILRTGEMGALQFHKAILQSVAGWTPFVLDNSSLGVVRKTTSDLNELSLKAGFQFTEWQGPNGVRVKIEVDPFYDDPVRNKITHPDGGVAESYRYDILYVGTMDQPNIQLAKPRGPEEYRGFQWGFRNPFTGETSNNNMSFDEDGAVVHRYWQGGVFILDPTRTVSIIPAILQ